MRTVTSLLLALCSTTTFAKTSLYGEVNGYSEAQFYDGESTVQLSGALSEFGFRNRLEIDDQMSSMFDVSIGMDPLNAGEPFINEGQLGIEGSFGDISLFYGKTPVGQTNDMLQLMRLDPDKLSGLFSLTTSNALNVPVGLMYDEGIRYRSPKISNNLSVAFALLPAEETEGETGFSFTGTYADNVSTVVIGFEINKETEGDQLLRIIGETKRGTLTLGGGLQLASNTDVDTSANTLFAYGKMPMKFGQLNTRSKAMASISRLTDTADDTTSEFYASFVNEQPWADKVSTYGFVHYEMINDLDDTGLGIGAGMKMTF